MNILVCIKQVPDTTEIKIDPVTNTLIRAGVPSIVNPFDAYALEIAARIKDVTPETKIILLSMGPKQAEAALKECLAVGGDKAYLVSDRAFGGADTLATSYTLKTAIDKIETVTKPSFSPRYPTIKSKMAANRATINTLTAADIPVDAERIGLKGSPTKVKKSFTPPQKQGGVVVKEDSPEASAQKLFELLNSAHIV